MTFRSSPIPDFLRAFGDGRAESLEPFLHEDVAYRVDGFEPVIGRRAVLAFWRRMFTAHDAVRMSLERQVRDGDVVIAAQRQLYLAGRRQPLRFGSFVISELEDERIRDWSDRLQIEALDEEDAAVWRRLPSARWYLEKACAKLRVRTRVEAVAAAVREGLIEVEE